jgi:molybdopterin synthase catalytic subunit
VSRGYDAAVSRALVPPTDGDTWVGLSDDELPVAAAYEWCVLPRTGAVVLFSGVVRDHATDDEGTVRSGVHELTYEAYESQIAPSFLGIVDELRVRWPLTGRVVLLHRVGVLALGESSVIAVVSAPHRAEAFEAARFAIDALKSSAPIWKREEWQAADGSVNAGWGTGAHDLVDPASVSVEAVE